jgi:fatty acid desaturase
MGNKNFNYDKLARERNKTLFQIALVAGIVILAANDLDGWGWLVFILLCTV